MAEGKEKVVNKKVEGNGEKNRKPVETVNMYTSNGILSFSVWEGGSISVRVSRRKNGTDEYETIWSARINPVDFISQSGDLRTIAKTAQEELKKVLGMDI